MTAMDGGLSFCFPPAIILPARRGQCHTPYGNYDKFSLQNYLTSVLGNGMMKMQTKPGKGVLPMTREEILEMSRMENKSSDERELLMIQKSKAISQGVSLVFCMLLQVVCLVTDGPALIAQTAWTIISINYAVDSLYQGIKLKKPFFLIMGLIWVLAFFAFLRVLGNAFV